MKMILTQCAPAKQSTDAIVMAKRISLTAYYRTRMHHYSLDELC